MELNEEEIELQKQAIAYIRAHEDELIEKFITSKNPLRLPVLTFFMAGAPGSGKTEFSQRYVPDDFNDRKYEKLKTALKKSGVDVSKVDTLFVRIDVDEIREFLPHYQKTDPARGIKGNSHVIQKAANKGLDALRKYCFKNGISFLHDGTFGNYETMKEIIRESIKDSRKVIIFYIYIDPLSAWEFTKAREFLEGRNIVKEKFIDQFFKSKENLDRIKEEFGNNVEIHCVLKKKEERDTRVVAIELNASSVDNFLKNYYAKKLIKQYTREDLLDLIP